MWVLLNKVNESDWPIRKKRLATYGLVGFLIAVAIFVIDWHSSNYKANYAELHFNKPAIIYLIGQIKKAQSVIRCAFFYELFEFF